ncbi:MAG: class I SAM-dependent methyltransferase [Dehalococcoidia bacterium]|nr:class I SAM-dependent methyltransferase [Dehalococcoidia bacterium]
MNLHVCPWWLGYALSSPLRKLIHNPEKLLGEYVTTGNTVADIGCGSGYFSLAMARMVGEQGRVISVDLQERMLEMVRRRAQRAGLQSRIRLHQCREDNLEINEPVDFALAFYMIHEVPNAQAFFDEILTILKPNAHFLIAEPKIHVRASRFRNLVDMACKAGMKPLSEPKVRVSRAVLLGPC